MCTAARPIAELFDADVPPPTGDGTRMLMDDLSLSKQTAKASIFTGEDEIFAFRRTLSRLSEMRTQEYWDAATRAVHARAHLPRKTHITIARRTSPVDAG